MSKNEENFCKKNKIKNFDFFDLMMVLITWKKKARKKANTFLKMKNILAKKKKYKFSISLNSASLESHWKRHEEEMKSMVSKNQENFGQQKKKIDFFNLIDFLIFFNTTRIQTKIT